MIACEEGQKEATPLPNDDPEKTNDAFRIPDTGEN
jgi:hypothetical protein